jgi:hypothetical protein
VSGSLAKATIINLDNNGSAVDCMFNPEQYSVTKSNRWSAGDAMGTNMPHLEFAEGGPATMQMKLFFDTYTAAQDPASVKDVRREYTDSIWELMLVDDRLKDPKSKKSRPPRVRFQWGSAWSFDAVITHISQTFTLFAWNGTPVRAMLDVTFQQIKDERLFPSQNPTSGGVGGERVWTVQEGDTLAWIAYSEYGDPTRWRPIADANRLTNVRRLRPGTVLEIPNA